jgi:hypothetical protein
VQRLRGFVSLRRWHLKHNLIMDVQHHAVELTQRRTQDVVSRSLADILCR